MNDGVNPLQRSSSTRWRTSLPTGFKLTNCARHATNGAPFTFFRFDRMKNEVRRGRGQIASDWLEACRSGKTNTIRLTRSDDVVINVGLDA